MTTDPLDADIVAAVHERVAALDDDAFSTVAMILASAIRYEIGEHIVFEPGDATRYRIAVLPRRVHQIRSVSAFVFSWEANPIDPFYAWIGFEVGSRWCWSELAAVEFVDCDELHTAAVFQRVAAEVRAELGATLGVSS